MFVDEVVLIKADIFIPNFQRDSLDFNHHTYHINVSVSLSRGAHRSLQMHLLLY
jgi:hypothetical protein